MRDIRKHISSVKSIKQITYAMKMVAAARIKRAQNSILASRPFAREMEHMIADLYTEMETEDFNSSPAHALFESRKGAGSAGLVLITSDKGLAGSFNTNLLKNAVAWLRANKDKKIYAVCVGRKGRDFLKRLKGVDLEIVNEMVGIFPKVSYVHANLLAAAADHTRGATLVAGERSIAAARIAADLLGEAGVVARLFEWDGERAPQVPPGTYDLISLGYVVNELWPDRADRVQRRARMVSRLARSLAPDGVLLVMDPASLAPSRDLLALRDALVSTGHPVLAPCLTQRTCPALERSDGTCHSEITWPMPEVVQTLARRVGLHKDHLKMAWFAVGRAGASAPQHSRDAWRVVSEPMLNKAGRTRFLLCGASGRLNLSAKKGEGFPAQATFFDLGRGDLITLTRPTRRESGAGLGAETSLVWQGES